MFEAVGLPIERYMSLLSTRQQVVAANIANVDTPGYKTKDVDFHHQLAALTGDSEPAVSEVANLRIKNDGNNVNIDRESRLLAENSLHFSVASALVRDEIKNIRSAISDGAGA